MAQSGSFLRTWHVLAAEIAGDGSLTATRPDWHALTAGGHAAIPVIRIERRIRHDAARPLAAFLATLPEAVSSEVEIDFDCPTAHLPDYTAFLSALRIALPPATRIGITALPTWLASADFPALARHADSLVLQVHAMDDPRLGLFSAARARGWVDAFAQRTRRPFRLALPAYGARAAVSPTGALLAVAAEAPATDGASGFEMTADPAEIAAFLRTLRQNPPDTLRGLVWFRLPAATDRRAWSLATLRAVASGATPHPHITQILQPGWAPGVTNILLANDGDGDGILPDTVKLPAACTLADGAGQYRRGATGLVRRDAAAAPAFGAGALIRARDTVLAGWMRCRPDAEQRDHRNLS